MTRRTGRGRRRWLVAGLVLAVLLVVGDRAGEQVAEGALADRLAGELGTRPEVEIGGLPFLTQALRGRYSRIDVRADRVVREGRTLQDVTATLTGVQVSALQAARGEVTAVPVDALAVDALVTYDELERAGGLRDVQLGPDPDGVRVSGRLEVLGRDVDATAAADVQLDGSDGVLRTRRSEGRGGEVTGRLAEALSERLGLRVRVPQLPYDVRLSSLRPGPDGVVVTGGTGPVVLRP